MRSFVFVFSIAFSLFVQAQENSALTLKEPVAASENIVKVWTPQLKLSANFNLSSNENVIGQADGDSTAVTGKLESGLIYKKERNEWRQSLLLDEGTGKSPTPGVWVKTADMLKYETLYLRSLKNYPNIGPYAKVSAETAVFRGEDVRNNEVSYQLSSKSSNPGEVLNPSSRVLKLTDSFKPVKTKESVGFFAKLIDSPNKKLEIRLGVGALQVQADDQYFIEDDAATANIVEVGELESFDQVGIESGVFFNGKWNKISSYFVSLETLTPISPDIKSGSDLEDKNDVELTNIEAKLGFTSKVSDWANLQYEYKAIKQPQLLDEFQTQHGVVLNIAYDFYPLATKK